MRRYGIVLFALALAAAPARARAQLPLPLVEVPAAGGASHGLVAILLTADGGWAAFDREVAERLAAAGVPVVGWSSLAYYRRQRTPEGAAADLALVLRHYLPPGDGRAYLVGYSFGADVLPFLVNRLPPELRRRVAGVGLVGLSSFAVFQFHASEWVGVLRGPRYATLPEARRLDDLPVLCVYGRDDRDEACDALSMPNARVVAIDSGHRMGGVGAMVGDMLVHAAASAAAPAEAVGATRARSRRGM
jgi:type IV secretory pathway VirJ component